MNAIKRNIPDSRKISQIKRIHMTAICGTGMGSLAGLLQEKGFQVTGSDQSVYPPMSTQLKRMGIALHEGYDVSRLKGIDLIIVGNAISRGNVELEYALDQQIPCLSLPEALHLFFLSHAKPIVITGTHGKTTTSALISWILDICGKTPGFFVGGILANYDRSYQLGKENSPFVVEGDEYDSACFDKRPKFVHYVPDAAVLTSIEFDHADIYENLDQIKKEFAGFLRSMKTQSLLLACGEDENIREILGETKAQVELYGINPEKITDWVWAATHIQESATGVSFDLLKNQKHLGTFHTPMLGLHNLKNLLAVMGIVSRYGISPAQAMAAVKTFRGVLRRQQVRGVVHGITVIDDFAHHPTAVQVTLDALRKGYPTGQLWAVFEPRTATSRRKIFQEQYAKSFEAANHILIAPVFKGSALQEKDRFSSEDLVGDLQALGKKARLGQDVEGIVNILAKEVQSGDTIAILSNGGFGGIHEKLLSALKEKKFENAKH